ncbi:restriction endonuclease subunit S [Sphingobacterium sp. JUb21]|uniref:restriction endonuclease subunit S n=1 Tax=Sphingobacterium sp. JUb21 TaxID=2940616 RepID=UPI0021677B8C|nr:restriction endonuclease subunit S [Sphingobacterium sp. JUb21]MCS3557256.1 type I restriction enzyme S subunit [Sphingobacterium sp. JUb21]
MRFPDFHGEWETKKLGEIMDFKVTNSLSRENLNYEVGAVKNIHYGDIHTKFQTLFNITNEIVPFINDEINVERISDENYCREGDIIFADASEDLNDVGKSIEIINVNGEKLLSGLHTLLARPKSNVFHLGFNGYLFKSNSLRTQIQKESQGSKVLSINIGRISKIELSFPNVQEQGRITALLSLLDERMQTQNKIIEGLKSRKIIVLKQIFDQTLKFKNDEGNSYPDWTRKTLGDISERVVSKNKEDNKNVLTISAQHGLISQLEYFNKSVSAKDVTGYYLLKRDDFAYNKSYSAGYPMGAIKRLIRYDKGVVSTLYICFRFNELVSKTFMEQYFEAGLQNIEIEKIAQEGARNHGLLNIGISDFFNISLILPSFSEQKKIADFLSVLDNSISNEITYLQKLEEQKKFFLRNLFV